MNWKLILCLLPAILLCINSFIHIFSDEVSTDARRTTILVPVDTLISTPSRNSALISILQESISKDLSMSESRTNINIQFRLFYVAILAALVTLVYSSNVSSIPIRLYLLMFIFCMYGLEVHHEDLNWRLDNLRNIKHHDIEFLINLNPGNTTWYNVCPSDSVWNELKVTSLNNDLSSRLKTWSRKLRRFCQPDFDQVVIYILPWIFLFYFKPKK